MTPSGHEKPRLICVDDEPFVLEGLSLHLRRFYRLATATSGAAALEIIRKDGPFAIVLSDMRMPGMNGAEFLAKVRELHPDTVRLLLTGHSDLESAILAVNEGQIFRFLSKPCPPNVLLPALEAAARQYELIHAERILLEQTLHGSIQSLTEVLALANPTAFGRASRAKQYMTQLRAAMGLPSDWQCEVSAMVSQIGAITLPVETLQRIYEGQPLSAEEEQMAARLPATAEELLGSIPRLEPVRDILRHMAHDFEAGPKATAAGEAIPWGARALRIILDFTTLESRFGSTQDALDTMRGCSGSYDPNLLQAFATMLGKAAAKQEIRKLMVRDLKDGMVLQENVVTKNGALLVGRGQRVSPALLERIANFSRNVGVREPIAVVVARH